MREQRRRTREARPNRVSFPDFTPPCAAGYQTESSVGKGLNFLVVVPTGHCTAGGQVPWPKGQEGEATATAVALTMFKGEPLVTHVIADAFVFA